MCGCFLIQFWLHWYEFDFSSLSLFNEYLWYDKLWGPSQRVVTLFRMIHMISTYVAHFSSYFIPHASERKWLGALWINSDINVGWLIYFDRKSRGLLPCCLCTGGGLNHSAISFRCFCNCAPAPQRLGNIGFIINRILCPSTYLTFKRSQEC